MLAHCRKGRFKDSEQLFSLGCVLTLISQPLDERGLMGNALFAFRDVAAGLLEVGFASQQLGVAL